MKLIAIIFFGLFVSDIRAKQTHSINLDAVLEVTLSWNIDWENKVVAFHLKNAFDAIDKTYTWFAIGFSPRGKFPRTDLCFFQEGDENFVGSDVHVSDDGRDILIDEQNDCILKAQKTDDVLEFERKFDTCDEDDFPLHEGTIYLKWMRGSETLNLRESFPVPTLEIANEGLVYVQLLRADKITIPEKNVKYVDVVMKNVVIPANVTTYWHKVIKLDHTEKKRHFVSFEPLVRNERLIHHILLFHCEAKADVVIQPFEGGINDMPDALSVCSKVVTFWGLGGETFTLPEDIGAPFGGPDYNPYLVLQVHYNNPELVVGAIDNSGMRLKFVDKLRKFDSGVLEFGQEYIDKMAIPPGELAFPWMGYCTAECTKLGLPKEGIFIIGSELHTHERGRRAMIRHFRDGKELPEINRDDFYIYKYQEIRNLRKKPKVLPGDALVFVCYYDTRGYKQATVGGFSLREEMCSGYVYYYPLTKLEVCKSAVADKTLSKYFGKMKKDGNPDINISKGILHNYRAIEWTQERKDELFQMYTKQPLSMQCNVSDGTRLEGFGWEGAPTTKMPSMQPLEPPSCSKSGKSLRHSEDCDMLGDCIY